MLATSIQIIDYASVNFLIVSTPVVRFATIGKSCFPIVVEVKLQKKRLWEQKH